jgi:hypothetical protein
MDLEERVDAPELDTEPRTAHRRRRHDIAGSNLDEILARPGVELELPLGAQHPEKHERGAHGLGSPGVVERDRGVGERAIDLDGHLPNRAPGGVEVIGREVPLPVPSGIEPDPRDERAAVGGRRAGRK